MIYPKPDWSSRHASTQHTLRFFTSEHMSDGELKSVSMMFETFADMLVEKLDDGPELSAGLRKLLEAKDCCVRAALPDPSKSKAE